VAQTNSNALHELKRYEEVITHHDKVLSLKPGYAEARSNKEGALKLLNRQSELAKSSWVREDGPRLFFLGWLF